MAEPIKTANPLASVGGIVGAAGGWALSQYAGSSLWIPGAATVLILLVCAKMPWRPKFFLGAIAVTGGHVLWFLVASLMTQVWAATILDIVVLSTCILWLWLRPGLAPALVLSLVQLGSLAYNAYLLASNPVGSFVHRALTVHCIWRLVAFLCLIAGYLKLRRDRIAAASAPVS